MFIIISFGFPPPLTIWRLTTDRGILFDSEGSTAAGSSEAAFNYIHADLNRAFRVRAEAGDIFHHNYIANCRQGNPSKSGGCIHVGDEDIPADAAGTAEIYSNTIELNDGVGLDLVCMRAEDAANFHDNTVLCYGGNCAPAGYVGRTNVQAGANSGCKLTIKNNTIPGTYGNAVGGCGTAGTPTCTNNAYATSVDYHATGTVVCGTGADCNDVP